MFKRITKTKKFLSVIIAALLIVALAEVFSMTSIRNAYASEFDSGISYERHIPTLSDDFADNRVIVTLKRNYSGINKSIDLQSFRTSSVITAQEANSFNAQSKDFSNRTIIESVRDLTYVANPSMVKNRNNFAQILSIELRENSKENVLRAIKELEQLDHVLAAEPDYNIVAEDLWEPTTNQPDDTRFSEQWGLGAAPGAQIVGANGAWSISTGQASPRIRVGIFETGLDANHNDLRVNTSISNLVSSSPNHGTHVGGIIGAITDNDRGIAGIAQVELALLDRGDDGILTLNPNNTGVFAESLTWAFDNDIRIVNCSFRFIINNAVMRTPIVAHREAIVNYGENGGLLVVAAANDNDNLDNNWQFPASYGDVRNFPEINNVISVGSINSNGARRATSNFGLNSVHIYAPGGEILSTLPNNNYGYNSGTSMAAPYVSGVAALLLSANQNLTAVELRDAILDNADTFDINIPGGQHTNRRRLNAFAAVSAVSQLEYTVISGTNVSVKARAGAVLTCDVEIPSTVVIGGVTHTVTQIASSGFANQTFLSTILIPSSVTAIGDDAFVYCTSLTNIVLPANLTVIGDHTFYHCTSLTAITIPAKVESIGNDAFIYCRSLLSVTFGSASQLSAIGTYAFYECTALTSIPLPGSLTYLGSGAFYGCSKLTGVTLPEGLSFIGSYAFSYCTALTSVTLTNGLTNIESYAFSDCRSLTSITIPNSVTGIGSGAFSGCTSLTDIIIPYGVESIESYVFYRCTSLTGVTIPDSVLSIKNDAFRDCTSLTGITIPSSVTSIESNVFYMCTNLTTVSIERPFSPGVTAIHPYAFNNCIKLADIYVPADSVAAYKSAANGSGYAAKIQAVPFPATQGLSYTLSSNGTYYSVSKGSANTNGVIYIPAMYNHKPVKTIEIYAFYNCSGITQVIFEDNSPLETIENSAFAGCASLTDIVIPSGVTNLGYYAFYSCSSLTNVTLPTSLESISQSTFEYCGALTDITIPDAVLDIGVYAFHGCYNLTGIVIPNAVTYIGYQAFRDCYNLESVSLSNSLTEIGDEAFYECYSLTEITFPDSLLYIGSYAFHGCHLTDILIPASVTEIGHCAFVGSYGLDSIAVASGNAYYTGEGNCLIRKSDNVLLQGCSNSVIPSYVTEIEELAFSRSSILSVTIPSATTSIGDRAFSECSYLSSFYVQRYAPGSAQPITASEGDIFGYQNNVPAVYVPSGSVAAYKTAANWSSYAANIY